MEAGGGHKKEQKIKQLCEEKRQKKILKERTEKIIKSKAEGGSKNEMCRC